MVFLDYFVEQKQVKTGHSFSAIFFSIHPHPTPVN